MWVRRPAASPPWQLPQFCLLSRQLIFFLETQKFLDLRSSLNISVSTFMDSYRENCLISLLHLTPLLYRPVFYIITETLTFQSTPPCFSFSIISISLPSCWGESQFGFLNQWLWSSTSALLAHIVSIKGVTTMVFASNNYSPNALWCTVTLV